MCVYIYIYIYMCVCVYIYIYTHIYSAEGQGTLGDTRPLSRGRGAWAPVHPQLRFIPS